MTNVVIGYTGNVCSTPMVEYARLIDGVWVPVLEQFDEYQLIERWPDSKHVSRRLAETLEALYGRRTCADLESDSLLEYRDHGRIPSPREKPDVLFKWRPHSSWARGGAQLRKVFANNDVRPVVILRRSLSTQALKVFLSEEVYGGRHQQFAVAKLSEQDYERYLDEQRRIRIELSAAAMLKVAKIAKNFLERTRLMIRNMNYFFAANRPVAAIIAEDILKPGIDVDRYEAVLSRLLNRSVQLPNGIRPAVRKGGLNIENCVNSGEVLTSRCLMRLEHKYLKLLGRTQIISGARSLSHSRTSAETVANRMAS